MARQTQLLQNFWNIEKGSFFRHTNLSFICLSIQKVSLFLLIEVSSRVTRLEEGGYNAKNVGVKAFKDCVYTKKINIALTPDIPVLWNLAEIVKFGQPPPVWSGRVRIHNNNIWPDSELLLDCHLRVFKMSSLNVFVIVIVFFIVFLLVRSCFFHSDQMSQRSKVSKIAFWSCSPNVFVIVIVFVIVFLLVRSCFLTTLIKCLKGRSLKALNVFVLLVRSCFLMTPIRFARLGFGLEGFESVTVNMQNS